MGLVLRSDFKASVFSAAAAPPVPHSDPRWDGSQAEGQGGAAMEVLELGCALFSCSVPGIFPYLQGNVGILRVCTPKGCP